MEWEVLASPGSELQLQFRSFLPLVLHVLGLLLAQGGSSFRREAVSAPCAAQGLESPVILAGAKSTAHSM